MANLIGKLSTLDWFPPVWIIAATALGLGRAAPGLDNALSRIEAERISLPIALGLLAMRYPVLPKVRYDRLDTVRRPPPHVSSLALNWLVSPAVVFALTGSSLPTFPPTAPA